MYFSPSTINNIQRIYADVAKSEERLETRLAEIEKERQAKLARIVDEFPSILEDAKNDSDLIPDGAEVEICQGCGTGFFYFGGNQLCWKCAKR